MYPRTRQRLLVALAVALVAGPLWMPALDVADTDYEYQRVELAGDSLGRLTIVDGDTEFRLLSPVSGFDCLLASYEHGRRCLLEYSLVDGNATVEGSNSPTRLDGIDDYVLDDDRVVYRRTAVVRGEDTLDERLELGLERVDAETALGAVSYSSLSDPARRVVEQGSALTETPIPDAGRVLEVDGRYYVVQRTGTQTPGPSIPLLTTLFEIGCVAAGTALFLRET